MTDEQVRVALDLTPAKLKKMEMVLIGEALYRPLGDGTWVAYPPYPSTSVVD